MFEKKSNLEISFSLRRRQTDRRIWREGTLKKSATFETTMKEVAAKIIPTFAILNKLIF
jgi:hypothetical protein